MKTMDRIVIRQFLWLTLSAVVLCGHTARAQKTPTALFEKSVSETSRLIADWCAGKIQIDNPAEALADILGVPMPEVRRKLDKQSDDEIACSAFHDRTTTYRGPLGAETSGRLRDQLGSDPNAGKRYDFIEEWVTFKLTPTTAGTCVFVTAESQKYKRKRRPKPYTNLKHVFRKLGGRSPADQALCPRSGPERKESTP